MSKTFEQRFLELKNKLVVSKGNRNTFAGFNFRSKPDILEALKPLEHEFNIIVKTTSDLVELGGKVFVKSTAIAIDALDKNNFLEGTAFAELQPKQGTKMSEPQLTGSSDSYAGKYALGNLFGIDDNADPDTQDNSQPSVAHSGRVEPPTQPQVVIGQPTPPVQTPDTNKQSFALLKEKVFKNLTPTNNDFIAYYNELDLLLPLVGNDKDNADYKSTTLMINLKAQQAGLTLNKEKGRFE